MLFFDKLHWRIQSFCSKVFTLCLEFWPKTKIRKIVHTQRCLKKYFAYTNETEECCSLISSSERSIASAQIFSFRDWKLVKFKQTNQENSPHTRLPEEILCNQPRKLRMLFFDMFQWKIHGVGSKIFTPCLEIGQKQKSPKIVHTLDCLRKYFATSHEI